MLRPYKTTAEEYAALCQTSQIPEQRNAFWMKQASKLDWFTPPTVALDETSAPLYKWFPDGEINLCYNALDRHLEDRAQQTAIAYHSTVGGNSRDISYQALYDDVKSFAGSLKELGVEAGDRVIIYMPMVPEAVVAMLACTRIGAVHSVVFGGFASEQLTQRIEHQTPKVLITATCGLEGSTANGTVKTIPYMHLVDEALAGSAHDVPHVVVVERDEPAASSITYTPKPNRDHNFAAMLASDSEAGCTVLNANDPLYTIYTSGTTGDPKGILRDNVHPVMLQWTMDEYYKTFAGETYFAASDIGWVVGHSYIVYGPLIQGCTSVMYEGKPVGTPDAAEFWRIIERYNVKSMFTAPTALRAIRGEDPDGELHKEFDISSLKAIFLAGERSDTNTINHFTQLFSDNNVDCVDHWWQTESGSPMCGMQLDTVGTVPGSCGMPLPFYEMKVLQPADEETGTLGGAELPSNQQGSIAIKLPLPPGFMTTLYNNDERYQEAYLEEFPGYYSAGDAGYTDDNGYLNIVARTDDVINVAGHRFSTSAFEEVCSSHAAVVECAVFGVADELRGEVPLALVTVRAGTTDNKAVIAEIVQMVRERVGPVAMLRCGAVVPELPKTKSGKILRRTLRDIADNREVSNPDPTVTKQMLDDIKAAVAEIGYGTARE